MKKINRRSLGKRIRRFVSNLAERGLGDGDLVVEMSGGSPTQSTGRIVAVSKVLLTRYGISVLPTNFCKVIRTKNGFSYFCVFGMAPPPKVNTRTPCVYFWRRRSAITASSDFRPHKVLILI